MIAMLAEKLERKLQYFSNAMNQEVEAEKQQTIAETQTTAAKSTEEALDILKRRNKVLLQAKQEELRRASNRQIAEAKVRAMTELVDTRTAETDRLFVDTVAHLAEFTQTAEYENYLIERIKQTQQQADFTRVLLSPFDMRFEQAIKTATGLIPQAGNENFIGGFILLNESHTIQSDYTFKTVLENAKNCFSHDMDV